MTDQLGDGRPGSSGSPGKVNRDFPSSGTGWSIAFEHSGDDDARDKAIKGLETWGAGPADANQSDETVTATTRAGHWGQANRNERAGKRCRVGRERTELFGRSGCRS